MPHSFSVLALLLLKLLLFPLLSLPNFLCLFLFLFLFALLHPIGSSLSLSYHLSLALFSLSFPLFSPFSLSIPSSFQSESFSTSNLHTLLLPLLLRSVLFHPTPSSLLHACQTLQVSHLIRSWALSESWLNFNLTTTAPVTPQCTTILSQLFSPSRLFSLEMIPSLERAHFLVVSPGLF